MKLVLKVDERCIGTRGKLQITKDSAGKQRTDALGLMTGSIELKMCIQSRGASEKTYIGMDMDCEKIIFSTWRVDEPVLWGFCFTQENFEHTGYPLYAEEIISWNS
jgi:hypothetical protein